MFHKIKNWWNARKQPRVWATYLHGRWVKSVTYRKPSTYFPDHLMGPFRSEVDCEEFCDMRNGYPQSYSKRKHERT
jgi:hypothetical protein